MVGGSRGDWMTWRGWAKERQKREHRVTWLQNGIGEWVEGRREDRMP